MKLPKGMEAVPEPRPNCFGMSDWFEEAYTAMRMKHSVLLRTGLWVWRYSPGPNPRGFHWVCEQNKRLTLQASRYPLRTLRLHVDVEQRPHAVAKWSSLTYSEAGLLIAIDQALEAL